MASKTAIAAKEAEVKELATSLKDAKLILVVDFQGTSVADDTVLRKDLRNANAVSTVRKNNILRRAFEANKESGLDDLFVGPTALVTTTEDYVEPLKIVYKFSENHENYKIKGGIIEGKVMSVDEIIALAKLPSRTELLAKLAGSLLGNITKLAIVLDQVKQEKEKGAPAEDVKEEAAEEKTEEAPAEETKTEEPKAEEKPVEEEKKEEPKVEEKPAEEAKAEEPKAE